MRPGMPPRQPPPHLHAQEFGISMVKGYFRMRDQQRGTACRWSHVVNTLRVHLRQCLRRNFLIERMRPT